MASTGRPKALLELTDDERDQLMRWTRRRTSSQALALRSRIVLGCAEGLVKPAWAAGNYQLKAGPVIGVLAFGEGLLLRITPKITIRRVIYLLCHAAGLATWDDTLVELDDDCPIDIALAQAFVNAAERALHRGPRSGYYTVEDDLAEIRGRIDANRQRLRYGLPIPIAVTYDEYGLNIPENQLLLGAVVQLQRLAGLDGTLRRLRTGNRRRSRCSCESISSAR